MTYCLCPAHLNTDGRCTGQEYGNRGLSNYDYFTVCPAMVYVPLGFARFVGTAFQGSSGQGWRG